MLCLSKTYHNHSWAFKQTFVMLVVNILTADAEQIKHINAASLDNNTGRGFEHSIGPKSVSTFQLIDWVFATARSNVQYAQMFFDFLPLLSHYGWFKLCDDSYGSIHCACHYLGEGGTFLQRI